MHTAPLQRSTVLALGVCSLPSPTFDGREVQPKSKVAVKSADKRTIDSWRGFPACLHATSWGEDQATQRMVNHPGGNSLLPPWGLCPAVPLDRAPWEPLVILVGVKTRTLRRSWQCFCSSLLQLQFCLPGAPLAPEGKLHSMAFKTVPESFCFLQGLPNFLSPKQTSGLTYELRVSCILKGQKSLFSFKNLHSGQRSGPVCQGNMTANQLCQRCPALYWTTGF